ncbi:outer membrane protein assembly factor BamD [Peredibacter starrii]|uniref:Outer membrane protein assembly factor BamD n=1 Tax=Peredibacter starrii TaxID=28202 RepID=A0AAX4HQ15_9BACT|nr:outer membrane protein assembly factor BamD [Peredibacter starrii]WPU65300.1 outer membrane protein assembly factor BamD [Peredibacter starrii]
MRNIVFIVLIVLLASCSSDKPKGKTEAEILYKEAEELMGAERYILATEKLNLIKTQHPYSFYATPAELLQADILYLQENYIESAAAYLLFRDFHPRHEKIPYVVFKIAESYYKQIPDTIDRDLEPALESLKYYDEVIQKYGDSSYRTEAEQKIVKAKTMLREKDQYIADFYFKTKEFSAARYWYLDILENHQDEKTRNHAMVRTILATSKLKEWQPCLEYVEKFYSSIDKQSQKEIKSAKDECQKHL